MVALGRGGVTETVTDGSTGVLVDEPTAEAFADGISRAASLSFDPDLYSPAVGSFLT